MVLFYERSVIFAPLTQKLTIFPLKEGWRADQITKSRWIDHGIGPSKWAPNPWMHAHMVPSQSISPAILSPNCSSIYKVDLKMSVRRRKRQRLFAVTRDASRE